MRWMRWLLVMVVLAIPTTARADNSDLLNVLVGPVIGVRVSHGEGSPLTLGFEGGVGYGPERLNAGFEHRSDHDIGYVEIDPWYLIGGTLGVGVDESGTAVAIAGLWEGLPLDAPGSCSGWHNQLTISGGYRYTGVHELYLSVKAGRMRGNVCFD